MSAEPLKVHESLDAYKRDIPFFNYPHLYKRFESDFDRIFKDVCSRGAFIMQKDLESFEEAVREFLGVKHAFGVADGTNALMIGLWAMGIGEGDEVICPAHTYIASPASAWMNGAKPVLCDIGDDNLLDPYSAEKWITDKTKAIMSVHLNGRTCNMDKIFEIADKHNLQVVEDAAQALGSKFKGKSAGTFGAFGTFSLYPAKVLGCFGDGGLIVTNDDDLADKIYQIRDHGRDHSGKVQCWGTNSRLDNLQAAFVDFRLRDSYPKEDIPRRREIAAKYYEGLKDLTELDLPAAPSDGDHFDIFQNFEMAADRRDELREFLSKRGIGTIMQWAGVPIHGFPMITDQKPSDFPRTVKFFERTVILPLNMAMSNDDVDHVVAAVREFYGKV